MVWEDDCVGADEGKEGADQQLRSDTGGTAHRGMGEQGQGRELMGEGLDVGEAGKHGRDHNSVEAFSGRNAGLGAEGVEAAGEAGDIVRQTASCGGGAAGGSSAEGHASGEGGIGLVGEAVVILDEVDAAASETLDQIGQALGRQALGFDGGAGHGAVGGVGAGAQAGDAVARPRETGRWVEADQGDVGMQRGVAERHVQELGGIGADGGGREGDADVEEVAAAVADGVHVADDVGVDEFVGDGVERHFHALLNGDGASAGLNGSGIGVDAVSGGEAGHGGQCG